MPATALMRTEQLFIENNKGIKMSIIIICVGILFVYLLIVNMLRQFGKNIIDSDTDLYPALLLIFLGIGYVTGFARF